MKKKRRVVIPSKPLKGVFCSTWLALTATARRLQREISLAKPCPILGNAVGGSLALLSIKPVLHSPGISVLLGQKEACLPGGTGPATHRRYLA